MTRLVIMADDLTGACDTGAGFAQRGWRTTVSLEAANAAASNADVHVICTASRYLPQAEAVRAVQIAARSISPAVAYVYKKIDSTLRGHPGAELFALMNALSAERALITPAFPAQGRSVVDSRLYVHGQPLEQTVFAAEAPSGDLRTVFASSQWPYVALALADVRAGPIHLRQQLSQSVMCIADAETDADLSALAEAASASGIRVWCGSAGLAHALATLLPTHREALLSHNAIPLTSQHGAVLVIAGSQHPATARQIAYAEHIGMTVVHAPLTFTHDVAPSALAQLAQDTRTALSGGKDVIITPAGLPPSPLGQHLVAKRLGALAAQVLSEAPVAGLVLTGGDVAAAVCGALGAQQLALCGEVQPGIAMGALGDGPYAGLRVVTKAGGFGDDAALLSAIGALHTSGV
jgi:uncharacterized protein YgbK (DUF1537 family)